MSLFQTKLTTLDLASNRISKIQNVGHLTDLQEFWVGYSLNEPQSKKKPTTTTKNSLLQGCKILQKFTCTRASKLGQITCHSKNNLTFYRTC